MEARYLIGEFISENETCTETQICKSSDLKLQYCIYFKVDMKSVIRSENCVGQIQGENRKTSNLIS